MIKSQTAWWIGWVERLKNVRDELDNTSVGIGAQFEAFDSDLPDTQPTDDDLPDNEERPPDETDPDNELPDEADNPTKSDTEHNPNP